MTSFITATSFRLRLVIAAAATVFVVLLFGSLMDVYKGYSRLSLEMDARGELVVEQTAMSISGPLWDFDDMLVANILQSLLNIKGFASVQIISPDGTIDKELMSERSPKDADLRFYQQDIVIVDGNMAEVLGVLRVGIETSGMWAALRDVVFYKSLLMLTILGVASASLYVVLGRISKPLEELRNAIYAIEREEFDLPIPSRNRSDEIGALANALDGLREREAELSVLRRVSTEKSRRESKRIQQALQTTRDAVVLVDERNRVVFTNAAAETHFPDFTNGTELMDRRTTDRTRADALRAALLSRQETDMEISLMQADTARHFQARTGPIVDEAGHDLGGLFLASDFTEQFEQSKEASFLASHDPLTGVFNRRHMDVTLGEWCENPAQQIGIMLMDLDHFKMINDSYGHQNGDLLLMKIAEHFVELAQDRDLVIRLGGDEFAIISMGHDSEGHLERLAAKAIAWLQHPLQLKGCTVYASISAGIATTATAGSDIQALMRHADLALYEAKELGRGRCEIYKDQLMATHERRRKMVECLRDALEGPDIFPVFQAQTDIADGGVVGFEVLARWTDPELGAVSPAEFVPLAESAHLIGALTRKILTYACEAAVEWRAIGFHHRIAVNLSPKLFDGGILDLVTECLAATGATFDMIELEITESVLLSNSDAVRNEIGNLRAAGLTVALDDFGTGYSSLEYLRRFPVDKIKIDQAFVRNVSVSKQSRAIVTAIAQLGHSLGMQVTGEGAETTADRTALQSCGVDVVQGFVDGKPAIKSEAVGYFSFIADEQQPAGGVRAAR